ncbi:MAG: metallophosphoesterase [Casimicrobiaceae bacterium]
MMDGRAAPLLFATLGLLVASCATVPPPAVPVVTYAYVVVGPDGQAFARAIVAATTCPPLDVDGVAQPMTIRAPAQRIPQRKDQAKASDFPVAVCEHALPARAQRVALAGVALPLPKPTPSRIVVLGDTGCRLYASAFGSVFQRCDDTTQWPFARVAAAAAAMAPDLVIHTGDYHYRESPCPPALQGCEGSPWGYGFDAWSADFFAPARPLLAAAPWIVVRGNHETCDRAGQGWWRTLDPRPLAPRQDCNDVADDDVGDYSAPYAVPIGRGEQVLVFDSSNAGNLPIPVDSVAYRTYRAQLQQAFAVGSAPAAGTYFVAHHPPLAFAANPRTPASPYTGNAALQATLGSLFGGTLFPPSVAAVFSGHIHAFEAVTFTTGQPPQFVFGYGGTAADGPLPDPFPPQLTPLPGAVVRELRYIVRFGFATLDRAADGWTLTAYDVAGTPMETCTLAQRQAACKPIAR